MKQSNQFFQISWVFFILFFILGVFNMTFALLGLFCMIAPLALSLSGKGKKNCSHYCPRGSFLNKFLQKFSLNLKAPSWFFKKQTKYIIFSLMIVVFSLSIYSTHGDIRGIAFVIFRMVVVTSVIAITLGLVFKPRTWCAVCPMGHISGEITQLKNRKK